uniref:tRNA (adenine(58)-N(1))-methyltransferase non-catalytic subunit TRM6 n=1 Tax=Tetraselmis chuii TaxID=63592 RepID=A0A6U1KCN5_9CHLO
MKVVDGKQRVNRASPWAASEEQVGRWAASGGFTSCLVAAPALQPIAVMDRLLPLLAPSAPFAIFSNSPLPLAMAMAKLRKTGQALALQMTENWHREYQVLPARTHPTMSTSGTGGYILSGIKVISPPRTEADRSAKKPRT